VEEIKDAEPLSIGINLPPPLEKYEDTLEKPQSDQKRVPKVDHTAKLTPAKPARPTAAEIKELVKEAGGPFYDAEGNLITYRPSTDYDEHGNLINEAE
jgi:hypothetical protein